MRGHLKADEQKLYRLIWQRAIASQMAAKELETTTLELAAGEYRLRASATRTLFDGFARVYTEGRDDESEEAERTLPALAEGDVTSVESVIAHAALHRAAAPLHRGDADQGARGARHRPAVDVRGDDQHDRGPRLRPRRGSPAAAGGDRRDRDGPPGGPLRRVRRPRLHRPHGGGARRGRARRARVGAAPARLLRAAQGAGGREAQGAPPARLHHRGHRRGLLRGPPDGHPPRTEREVPRLLHLPGTQGDAPAARRRGARGWRATASPAPSAARASSRPGAAGSARSSAAPAIPTARTSGGTARRRPSRSRSRSAARSGETATSCRVAFGARGTSSGGAPRIPPATSRPTTSRPAPSTTRTRMAPARLRGRATPACA